MTALLALVVAGTPLSTVELPPWKEGATQVRLAIEIPEQGAGPARGRARYTLSILGPGDRTLAEPQLEDALAAWRISRTASSFSSDARDAIEITIDLVQVKPGAVPLPGIRLRLLDRGTKHWQEAVWLDPLNEPREVPPPIELPPLQEVSWQRTWIAIAGVLGTGLVAWGLCRAKWWKRRRTRQITAYERALARLEHMEGMSSSSEVLRAYLDERMGISASRMTTREVLTILGSREELSLNCTHAIQDILERGDREKYAGIVATQEDLDWMRTHTRACLSSLEGQLTSSGEQSRVR